MKHCKAKNLNLSNIETDASCNNGLSVTDHPMWPKLWDAKAARYNALAEQMEKAGADIQLLIDYRSAMEELQQLEIEHAHDKGFILGALAMTTPEKEGAVNA